MLNIYKLLSEHISNAVAVNGEHKLLYREEGWGEKVGGGRGERRAWREREAILQRCSGDREEGKGGREGVGGGYLATLLRLDGGKEVVERRDGERGKEVSEGGHGKKGRKIRVMEEGMERGGRRWG